MKVLTHDNGSTTAVPVQLQRDIEQFLYHEADVLDDCEFREWLVMLAPDIHYWAPVRENRLYRERDKQIAAPGTSAHFDENFAHLSQRVERLYTHMAWCEDPPSRTRHLITNIRVRETAVPDEWDVQSSFYIHRTRTERDHDWNVGRRYDVIRRADNAHGFQVARRTVLFDVATVLTKNLSLFY
ncbi:3-phenylpropionate/cinnamic acid dioxygenase subunit beta [Streptomyces sp. NPDC004542]|uniref:3-phenylpropionate/cinnamic acid dioxygenase subunit beta n=1 Tax=Streptomyces sp. NPDC004542 TaxID=3154281 RepID=UPI0033A7DC99